MKENSMDTEMLIGSEFVKGIEAEARLGAGA